LAGGSPQRGDHPFVDQLTHAPKPAADAAAHYVREIRKYPIHKRPRPRSQFPLRLLEPQAEDVPPFQLCRERCRPTRAWSQSISHTFEDKHRFSDLFNRVTARQRLRTRIKEQIKYVL